MDKASPKAPVVPAAKPQVVTAHPAVAEHLARFSDMAHTIDRLVAENRQLRYDLDCARQMVTELQHISDHERSEKEVYQRWVTRFDTLVSEIAEIAIKARSESAKAAALPPPEPDDAATPVRFADVDQSLVELARTLGVRNTP